LGGPLINFKGRMGPLFFRPESFKVFIFGGDFLGRFGKKRVIKEEVSK